MQTGLEDFLENTATPVVEAGDMAGRHGNDEIAQDIVDQDRGNQFFQHETQLLLE